MDNKKLSMEELNRMSVEDFKNSKKNNFCFVLDDIRSMSNVGSIFRTSDAFSIDKIYLCGITARPPHREIEKTALGATDTVEWEYFESILILIEKLKQENWKIVSIEQTQNSLKLDTFEPNLNEKYVFILGNEVFGVNENVIRNSDFTLEIPQFGTKHSLNVSVTAGIIAWHYCCAIING